MTPACHCKTPEPRHGGNLDRGRFCARCGHWIIEGVLDSAAALERVNRAARGVQLSAPISEVGTLGGPTGFDDVEVAFRCTSEACPAHEAFDEPDARPRAYLRTLSVEGCPCCGAKRLEVWHPQRGHVRIDWRSQKSVRKKRRRVA